MSGALGLGGDDVLDLGLVVHDEELAHQSVLLAELGHGAVDHLRDDVRGLAAFRRLFGSDGTLALDQRRIELVAGERLRVGSRDVHGELLAELVEHLRINLALERDEDADLAETRLHRIVDVGDDDALRHLQNGRAPERLVLADGRDVGGELLFDGAAARILGRENSLDRSAAVERELGDRAHELLELLVLGDEVGLRIDLDDGAAIALDRDSDQPFGGGAAGLLGGGGETLGAKPVDRGFHVALGLAQSLLAVHHAGAGALAQFLDGRGRDFSHFTYPCAYRTPAQGRGPILRLGPGLGRDSWVQASARAASAGGASIAPMSSPRAWAPPDLPAKAESAMASQ